MHTRLFCKRAEFNWTLSLFVHCLTVKLARSSHSYFHRNFFPCIFKRVDGKKLVQFFFCFVMWISEWIQYSFIIELCMWLHCSKCNKWCYCPLSEHLNRKTQAKKITFTNIALQTTCKKKHKFHLFSFYVSRLVKWMW